MNVWSKKAISFTGVKKEEVREKEIKLSCKKGMSCRGNDNCKVSETGLFLALTGAILHTISSKDTYVLQRAPIFKKMQNFQKLLAIPSF